MDIGGTVVLKTSDGIDISSMSGPMEKEQTKQFFPFSESPPDPILYFDIDSSIKPKDALSIRQVERMVAGLIRKNWSTNNKVLKLLSGK